MRATPVPADALAAVAEAIGAEGLLEPGQRVLAAFSGGADSTALLLVLDALGYEVVAGHVDHGLRDDSGDDAAHCRAAAAELGIPIRVVRLSGVGRGEAAARRARYSALEEMACLAGAGAVATGHTLEDDAETVLLRLGRGGYPLGIPPRRGNVVRPLLTLRRRQTAEICHAAGLAFRTDPTNGDETIARNRIRHQVLPRFGDAGILALAELAEATRLAKQRRDRVLDALMAGLASPAGPGHGVRLDRTALTALPHDLQRAVLRRALEGLGLDPTWRLVGDVAAKVVPTSGASLDLPGGLVAWCEATEVVAGRRAPQPGPSPTRLAAPGHTCLPEWGPDGLEVVVDELAPPPVPRPGPWEAFLDGDLCRTAGPLAIRSRRPGDRYRPLGAPGGRKLQDVMVDLKVPRAERDSVPLLTAGGRIAWVGGHRIDDGFKLGPASRAALRVRVFPLLPGGGGHPYHVG